MGIDTTSNKISSRLTNYDVAQEQYLFDEDGLIKKVQKNTLIRIIYFSE